jgi:hypothetical protein
VQLENAANFKTPGASFKVGTAVSYSVASVCHRTQPPCWSAAYRQLHGQAFDVFLCKTSKAEFEMFDFIKIFIERLQRVHGILTDLF